MCDILYTTKRKEGEAHAAEESDQLFNGEAESTGGGDEKLWDTRVPTVLLKQRKSDKQASGI